VNGHEGDVDQHQEMSVGKKGLQFGPKAQLYLEMNQKQKECDVS